MTTQRDSRQEQCSAIGSPGPEGEDLPVNRRLYRVVFFGLHLIVGILPSLGIVVLLGGHLTGPVSWWLIVGSLVLLYAINVGVHYVAMTVWLDRNHKTLLAPVRETAAMLIAPVVATVVAGAAGIGAGLITGRMDWTVAFALAMMVVGVFFSRKDLRSYAILMALPPCALAGERYDPNRGEYVLLVEYKGERGVLLF